MIKKIIVLFILISFSQSVFEEKEASTFYKLTARCIACLKKLGIYTESSLRLLKPGMIVKENTLIALEKKVYRSSSANFRELIDLNSYGFKKCVKKPQKSGQKIEEQKKNETLENAMFNDISLLETECSIEIENKLKEGRQGAIDLVCQKKYDNETYCFPNMIVLNVTNHFNWKCFKKYGKNLFKTQ